MTPQEVIDKGREIAQELVENLADPNKQTAAKQVYFMDNSERIKGCMNDLNQLIATASANIGTDPDIIDGEQSAILSDAKKIVQDMQQTISDFQKLLMISADVSEEQTTPKLDEQTLADAKKNNSTTQEIVQSMDAIASTKAAPYNYALMCDGKITLLHANTKDELNNAINAVANTGQYKDIKLFQLTFTPVPLKQKTILTV